MLNRQDDIGGDAVALPRRNIFAPAGPRREPPSGTLSSTTRPARRQSADGPRRPRLRVRRVAEARARRVARLVPAAAIAGLVVVLLAARGPHDAAPRCPSARRLRRRRLKAIARGPWTGPRQRRVRRFLDRRAPRAAPASRTVARPSPSHGEPSHRVAAPSPTPAPPAPRASPGAAAGDEARAGSCRFPTRVHVTPEALDGS